MGVRIRDTRNVLSTDEEAQGKVIVWKTRADLRTITKQISGAEGTKAYGEVKIRFHLFLNSALQRISGQLHASGQSSPGCIERVCWGGGGPVLPFGEEKKISCPFRDSNHVSWNVLPFSLVTIPTELIIIMSLSVCVYFLARNPPPSGPRHPYSRGF